MWAGSSSLQAFCMPHSLAPLWAHISVMSLEQSRSLDIWLFGEWGVPILELWCKPIAHQSTWSGAVGRGRPGYSQVNTEDNKAPRGYLVPCSKSWSWERAQKGLKPRLSASWSDLPHRPATTPPSLTHTKLKTWPQAFYDLLSKGVLPQLMGSSALLSPFCIPISICQDTQSSKYHLVVRNV